MDKERFLSILPVHSASVISYADKRYSASGKLNEVSPFLCCSEKFFIRTADTLAEELYREQNPAFMRRFYPQIAQNSAE